METATNAENIMPSLNVRDLVKKKKRDEISCLEDSFQFLEVEKSVFVEVLNEKCINDWTVQHGWTWIHKRSNDDL